MLPQDISDRYQKFQLALERLEQIATEDNTDSAQLRDSFGAVQQIFQNQIASLSGDRPDSAILPRVQSYLTEIDKQMRLLLMDVMFLQAARRSETAQARLAQIRDRLHTLMEYCQALRQIENSDSTGRGKPA